jgi:hippurate hydrolase
MRITIRGRGGHGAMPHLTADPVVAAAQVITALQTIASRNANPVDAIVVSVCSMETSQLGTFNVIPGHVLLVGTVRTFKQEMRDLAERRVREIATAIAQALGTSAEIEYRRGYPATVNTEREAVFAAKVGERVFGAGQRDHRCRADHGRRGFFLYAAGATRRLRVSGAGGRDRAAASCIIPGTISTTR